MEIKESSRLVAMSDIVSRKNDNGTIIIMKMDDSDVFYKVSGVAAEIWSESIDNNKTLKAIQNEILEKYNVDPDVLQKDTQQLLVDLESKNLAQVK